MKRIALIALLALSACDQAVPQATIKIPDKPSGPPISREDADRMVLTARVQSLKSSTCINGVVYYVMAAGSSAATLTPAFQPHGHGTMDCEGGLTIPVHNRYEPIK